MKSMQLVEFGTPIAQVEGETPAPQGKQVLLRVQASSVCHTDLHVWHGGYDLGHGRRLAFKERGVRLPLTMGHENVGTIIAAGPQAGDVALGEPMLVYPWLGCGHCEMCREGLENYCLAPDTIGVYRDGGYADHLLVPDPRCLVPLRGLDPVKAAPLACSGLTTFSALRKFDAARLRHIPLVVIGAGGLGLMSLKLLKAMGGHGAIVLETNASRREAALQAGALAALDPMGPEVLDRVRSAADGPVLSVLDLVGSETSSAMAFELLGKGGHLITLGLFGGAAPWSLPLITLKAVTIQGSFVGSLPELRELVDLVADQQLDLVPTTTRPLDELPDVLDALEQGRVVGRTVMVPGA